MFPSTPWISLAWRCRRAVLPILALSIPMTFGYSIPPKEESASASSSAPAPQVTLAAGPREPPRQANKPIFHNLFAIGFMEDAPGESGLKGKWLVGDLDGLKVVAEVGGRYRAALMPDSPVEVTALAVRPLLSSPENPFLAVFAARCAGARFELWAIGLNGKLRRLCPENPGDPSSSASSASSASASASLAIPTSFGFVPALVLRGDGSVLVLDSGRRQVCRVSRTGHQTTLVRIRPYGPLDFQAPEWRGMDWNRFYMMGMTWDPGTGNVFVADGHCIRQISPAGVVETLLGVFETKGDDDQADPVPRGLPCLSSPGALSFAHGALYLAGQGQHVVRRFQLATRELRTLAGGPEVLDMGRCEALAIKSDGSLFAAWSQTIRQLPDLAAAANPAGALLNAAAAAGPSQGAGDGGGSFWPALLADPGRYDPDRFRQQLLACTDPAHLNELYAGDHPDLQGATPLLRLLELGDEANALALIDRLRRQDQGGWNAAFTGGTFAGVNVFLYAMVNHCLAVAHRLSLIPDIDSASRSAFTEFGLRARPNVVPSMLYPVADGDRELAHWIILDNGQNPDFFNFQFYYNPATRFNINGLLAMLYLEAIQQGQRPDPLLRDMLDTITLATRPRPVPGKAARATAAVPPVATAEVSSQAEPKADEGAVPRPPPLDPAGVRHAHSGLSGHREASADLLKKMKAVLKKECQIERLQANLQKLKTVHDQLQRLGRDRAPEIAALLANQDARADSLQEELDHAAALARTLKQLAWYVDGMCTEVRERKAQMPGWDLFLLEHHLKKWLPVMVSEFQLMFKELHERQEEAQAQVARFNQLLIAGIRP